MGRVPPRIAGHVAVRHGGRLAYGAGSGMVDYSSSITPLGTPPAVVRAIRGAARTVSEYPDPGSGALLGALSRYTGLPRSNLVAGNGAVELIYAVAHAFGGGRALVCAPTFGEYEAAVRMYHGGSGIVRHAGKKMEKKKKKKDAWLSPTDIDGLLRRVPDNGMVFLCNPNNPTGELLTRRQVREILDAAASAGSCHVLVDECFIEMSRNPRESVMPYVRKEKYGNLVVLRSLTKSFGLPGIRVGYAAAPRDVADVIRKTTVPWSVSCLAEAAGVAALSDARDILRRTRDVVRAELRYVQGRLSKIPGVECRDTDANFVLVRTRLGAPRLQGLLAGRGMLVRDCSDFAGLDGHHVRIAIKRRRENRMLADALEDIMR